MNLSNLISLTYWNSLARSHLSDLVMILAATIVVLLDRPVRRLVHRVTRRYNRVLRFLVFVAVCSFGYAALTLACAALLRVALTINKGHFMAPLALGILIVVGVVAERQRQI